MRVFRDAMEDERDGSSVHAGLRAWCARGRAVQAQARRGGAATGAVAVWCPGGGIVEDKEREETRTCFNIVGERIVKTCFGMLTDLRGLPARQGRGNDAALFGFGRCIPQDPVWLDHAS